MGTTVMMVFACLVIAASISTAVGCNVFILAGQSNMAGRGGIVTANGESQSDRKTPPECESNPQILGLNDELLWEEAQEPLHHGISLSNCRQSDQVNGIGPGMPFSNSVLKRDPSFGVIGLVPCAVGGTGISEWSRGSCLYNRMLKRVRAALLEGGVLWYQGETDADNRENADMYGRRLETFFNDLRSDLLCPWLPIIQEEKILLNTSLPNVKCVDAAGLPLNGDSLHLTTDSQVRLGSMLADVYLRYFN